MKKINIITSLGIILAMLALFVGPLVEFAYAAALTDKSDTLTSLKVSVNADHTILFTTPTGVASGETIILTWDSDFIIGATLDFEDMDLSSQGTPDGVCDTGDVEETLVDTGATSSQWDAVKTSSTVITFTSGGATAIIAAGAEVCIEIGTNAEEGVTGVEQIANATSANSYTLAITGSQTDSGNIVITIITDDVVVVNASVDESLSFAIGGDNDIVFGTLVAANARFAGDSAGSDGATSSSAHNMTVATNASNGYSITYNGDTLTSGGDTITIATITADEDGTPGTEQFAIGFVTDGDATIATAYDQATATFNYSFVINTTTVIVSETNPTATETITAFYLANIGGSTEAGTYTTSITYIATANF